jgi:hypothetical protein
MPELACATRCFRSMDYTSSLDSRSSYIYDHYIYWATIMLRLMEAAKFYFCDVILTLLFCFWSLIKWICNHRVFRVFEQHNVCSLILFAYILLSPIFLCFYLWYSHGNQVQGVDSSAMILRTSVIREKTIYANSAILASRSPFFL